MLLWLNSSICCHFLKIANVATEMGYFKPFFHLILHAPHHTRALLSMKMAVFTDSPMNFVTPSGKRGQIPDEKGKIARLSGKKA